MAKLTVSFKGRLIAIHHLDEQPVTIGHDPNCRIHIDSLAVAPRHVELLVTDTGYLMLALDPNFPVLVNGKTVEQAKLHPGDIIQVGKHSISLSEDEPEVIISLPSQVPDTTSGQEPKDEDGVAAYIQVQSGGNIGKVVSLRRVVTRLKWAGIHDLAVTREGNSHILVRLNQDLVVKVDGKPMKEEEIVLSDNTSIEVGNIRLGYFQRKRQT